MYNPRKIEKAVRQYWEENKVYKVDIDNGKPKYYVLDMFPYPSGAGLHVGHPLGYIASDIFSRYKRLNGFNVLHPMGYDAFGLPAEQYAIQTGVHPEISTDKNIARYREQLDNIGFSFDWDREVRTSQPEYHKWTQWIFLQLFEHWYDTAQQKARPIAELVELFENSGTANVHAAMGEPMFFAVADWRSKSAVEKAETLMNFRLAFRTKTFVNWCEELGTVLANDEVKDGVSERGGYPVERRAMLQWSLRITAYAERLLNDLEDLEWSDSMKKMQANWIGRSEGAQVFFEIEKHKEKIEVFTTRPDTIFGATYMVLAPEHDLVAEITTEEQKGAIEEYVRYANARSERDRMSDVKNVTGAFTGAYALNPFTKTRIPIWIGDYVLKDYGTGAIMAVPSDDERDKRFAEKFGLEIIDVVDKSEYEGATLDDKVGKMINSDFLNGMEVKDAIQEVIKALEKKAIGTRLINYRLRDAIFSRQRYWGEPFPITYDSEGIAHPMDVADLPLELPKLDDFKPASGAKSPLARATEWVNYKEGWTRETDTMPGFAGSSWYFLRYMDANNPNEFASQEAINYWQDVDLYVGGTEHAVGHLMYSRFWHKFLHDKGLVPTVEPFKKLINQGMIQGVIELVYMQKEKVEGVNRFVCAAIAEKEADNEFVKIPVHIDFVNDYGLATSHLTMEGVKQFIDWRPEYKDAIFDCGQGSYQSGVFTANGDGTGSHVITASEVGKMSKSKYNVINPDDVIEKYGADCFRMFEMFLGPVEQSKPWDIKGINGVASFLRKYYDLFFTEEDELLVTEEAATKEELKVLHTAIKKVTDDIQRFSFNTCVSGFMVAVNDLRKLKCHKRAILEPLTVLLAPFAPHVAEHMWRDVFKNEGTINEASFPEFDEKHLKEDSITYPIAINGKTRLTENFSADLSKDEIEKAALALPGLAKYTEGKTIRKVIVVPGRMVNIVVG